jgi:hypothetical protein
MPPARFPRQALRMDNAVFQGVFPALSYTGAYLHEGPELRRRSVLSPLGSHGQLRPVKRVVVTSARHRG